MARRVGAFRHSGRSSCSDVQTVSLSRAVSLPYHTPRPGRACRHHLTGAVAEQTLHAGVDSIGLLGSTGVYAYLGREERGRAVQAAVECLQGRVPLLVGVGALRTDEAEDLARDAEGYGADALLMAPVALPRDRVMTSHFLAHLSAELAELRTAGLYKSERVITSTQSAGVHLSTGERVLNLCANNYLGLADDPDVRDAAKAAIDKYGYGMASVRFICGTQEEHSHRLQLVEMSLACPSCGSSIRRLGSWFKTMSRFACPSCGNTVHLGYQDKLELFSKYDPEAPTR